MPHRTLAIGDIHGCLAQLDALLNALEPAHNDHLVFLGDYVDRGPNSSGVLKRLIRLALTHHCTFLQGNHEEMMVAARGDRAIFGEWQFNGGIATLKSYRGKLSKIPEDHWRFLETLTPYLETDTHIFVHAGAAPNIDMLEQSGTTLRWELFDAIAPHKSGKIIVCGHTTQFDARPANRGYAICLDTNACRGGALTCLDTTSGKVWQADAKSKILRANISDFKENPSP